MNTVLLLLASALFALIGTMVGIITGLVPGIHVNLVASISVSCQSLLALLVLLLFGWSEPSEIEIVILMCSLVVGNLVSHTFLDFIPSIFLGAPEGDTALSVLPGHRMLLEGKGYQAILLSAYGSIFSFLLALVLLLPARLLLGAPVFGYQKLRGSIPMILILIVALLVLSERGKTVKSKETVVFCHIPEGLRRKGSPLEPKDTLLSVVPRRPLSEIEHRTGELVRLCGRISLTGESSFVLTDETGSARVLTDSDTDLREGEEVFVFGSVQKEIKRQNGLIQKGKAIFLFLFSGFLGYILFTSPGLFPPWSFLIPQLMIERSMVFFLPLFSGLFGVSTLVLSLIDKPVIPPQDLNDTDLHLSKRRRLKAVVRGTIAGAFVGWFPGISSATATVIARFLGEDQEDENAGTFLKEFMVSISGVNTSTALFTVLALFVILRARSGAMSAIQVLASSVIVPWNQIDRLPLFMSILLVSATVTAVVSYWLTIYLGKLFARFSCSISYELLAKSVIAFLVVMVLFLSGFCGLFIFAVSTCLGLIPPLAGVKRVHLMACLVLPIILLFW